MKFAVTIFLLAPVLLAGCSSRTAKVTKDAVQQQAVAPVPGANGIKGAPDWVNNGNNTRDKPDTRVFLGVAKAERTGDMAMQKAIADDNARLEVERVLSAYFEEVLVKYLARSKSAAETGMIVRLNNTSKAVMATVRIAGSWRDNDSGMIWSMAELDVGQIGRVSASSAELEAELKSLLIESSVTYFDRFLKEKK